MTSRQTASLQSAKQRVSAATSAPLWALLFESIIRGITGVIVLLLVFIMGTIVIQGGPRLIGVEVRSPELLIQAGERTSSDAEPLPVGLRVRADSGRLNFAYHEVEKSSFPLPESGVTEWVSGDLKVVADRDTLRATWRDKQSEVQRGQHLEFEGGALLHRDYSIWKFNTAFLTEAPREGMEQGGIFPALFGTLFVVLFMILLALPLGVFGAVYLVEYSKGGFVSRLIRAAVNNLAGVPSIVFGLFGLGFFVLFVGRNLDYYALGVPRNEAEVKVAEERIRPDVERVREEAIAIAKERNLKGPERGTFIREHVAKNAPAVPKRFFGQGAMFWASATLAILVLPVIIVSTEEALRAVPASLREAAYGLGATKWQVISTVVLPQARGGILTGAILAVARGAGELAPILFVGVTFFAPNLPLTDPINFYFFEMPVVNPFQQFMYLNYHIYTMATQHTNPEGTRAIQFATTLVLVALTFMMNLAAIMLRRRLTRSTR